MTSTVITGGRVIDGLGGDPIENGMVVIESGRIAAVGPAGGATLPRFTLQNPILDHALWRPRRHSEGQHLFGNPSRWHTPSAEPPSPRRACDAPTSP